MEIDLREPGGHSFSIRGLDSDLPLRLQVEHDPAHGERLLLAHQERDRVSGRNPAGAILHPLFTQVGHS